MKKTFMALCLALNMGFSEEIYATFDVLSEQSSELGLSVSGIIGAINVDVGSKVKKGELLLSLANSQEKLEVNNAKITLEIAKKSAELASKNYARYAKIADITDKEKMDAYLFDKELKALAYDQAKVGLALREFYFEKTELRAPYDLIVTQKYVEVGSMVAPSSTKLLKVISANSVKLLLRCDEKYWQKLKVGQTFRYKVDGSSETYEGKISKVYPTIILSTRELQAEVKAAGLPVGLFGDGVIVVE